MTQLSVVALVIYLAAPAFGQADLTLEALAARFDAAVREAIPSARLEPVALPERRRYEYQRWRLDDLSVRVQYYLLEPDDDAKDNLWKWIQRPIPSRPVDGLGDEAYLFAPSDPNGDRVLTLRRGRVVLEVTARGEANVRRFAGLFVAEIDKAIQL